MLLKMTVYYPSTDPFPESLGSTNHYVLISILLVIVSL